MKSVKLRNISLRGKIIAGYLVIIGIMGAISAMIYINQRSFTESLLTDEKRLLLLKEINTITSGMIDMETGLRGFVLTGNREFLQPFKQGSEMVDKGFSRISGLSPKELEPAFDDLKRISDRWRTDIAARILEPARKGRMQDAMAIIGSTAGKKEMDAFRAKAEEIYNTLEGSIKKSLKESKDGAKYLLHITLWGTGLAMISGIMVALFTAVSFTRPITSTTAALKGIAEGKGDLTREMPIDSTNEIGELSKWFNAFLKHLAAMIRQMLDYIPKLSSSSEEIAAAAEEMIRGAESQLNHVVSTSSAMEEMTAAIKEVSKNARDTAGTAAAAVEIAKKGSENLKKALHGIALSNEAVKGLALQAQRVEKVTRVIKDVAAQTNILAINASIEAVRAGEHGRSFEVVAEEIRKLAMKTGSATEEVARITANIQREIDDAVASTEMNTRIAQETETDLNDIVEGITATSNMVDNISAASAQQAKSSDEISRAFQEIAIVSRQTAKAAGEVAKAVTDIRALAGELDEIASQFKV